ncbi:MAG: TIR domain-containing protein [Bacteroidota bacterium]|nr:TIR domain-containing protein [Bacteroidota bacterium]
MAHDVFISYSSKDKKAADDVCSILEKEGISCWMAPRDITPGVPFAEAIIDAIKESKVFILIFSSGSNQSSQVIKEVDRAVHHGLDIITLRLEDVPLSKKLEYYISDVHWLDSMAPPLEQHINQLYRVVQKLLGKEEVSIDLIEKEQVKKKSIIVIPFENISSDPEQEYFSDGLTEEIISDLSHIDDLLVISRSSAMTFKGSRDTIKEISRKVKVRYALEGSVRKAGDNIRVTAQLIDGITDTHLWAEKYNETLDNIFEVQEKISRQIADSLQIKLSKEEKSKLKDHSDQNLQASECWFRAKQEIHRFTAESFSRAQSILEKGLEQYGDNELLLWGLGYINWYYVNTGIYLDESYLKKAEAYAEKIFEINKESFYGYQLLGLIAYKRGNTRESIYQTKKALAIEPNNPEVLHNIIWMYADTGKTHQSYELVDRLLLIDPLTSRNPWVKGLTFLTEGRFEECVPAFYRAYELDPENIVWKLFYVYALLMAGRTEEALEFTAPMEENQGEDIFINLILCIKNAFLENKDQTLSLIKDEFLKFAEWDELISLFITECFSLINEKGRALFWLENTVNRGFINYPFLNEYDFTLENIRGTGEYNKIMKRVKEEWEGLEV